MEILWYMIISTDRAVWANRPDIVIRDKENRKTYIIDISCPSDVNVVAKENEKITKYGALRVELRKMWDCDCEVVPVVVGGLGAISQNFDTYLKRIPATICKEMCQKITLSGFLSHNHSIGRIGLKNPNFLCSSHMKKYFYPIFTSCTHCLKV